MKKCLFSTLFFLTVNAMAGIGVHLDPSKTPIRVLFIEDGYESINTSNTPELIILDDTQGPEVKVQFDEIVALREQKVPDIYIAFDGVNFREMDKTEKEQVDADIQAALAAAEAAKIQQFDDLLFDTKPDDAALLKVFSVIDSLQSVDDMKIFLKRMVVFMVKHGRTGP